MGLPVVEIGDGKPEPHIFHPNVPHLRSGSCTSPRVFGLGFLQTSPHDDALALLLAFGAANTWHEDFHLASSVPCSAHTARLQPPRNEVGWKPLFGLFCPPICTLSFFGAIGGRPQSQQGCGGAFQRMRLGFARLRL